VDAKIQQRIAEFLSQNGFGFATIPDGANKHELDSTGQGDTVGTGLCAALCWVRCWQCLNDVHW
jgi:hypothetical protein